MDQLLQTYTFAHFELILILMGWGLFCFILGTTWDKAKRANSQVDEWVYSEARKQPMRHRPMAVKVEDEITDDVPLFLRKQAD